MTDTSTQPRPITDLDATELRVLIDQALTELQALLPLLGDLVDTRQRGLGFITATGRQALDKQVRKEHEARLPNLKAGVVITGDVPAPVNIAAVSLSGEIQTQLAHLTARLRRRMAEVGICPATRPPVGERPSTRQIIADARTVVRLVGSKKLLLEVARITQALTDQSRNFVHGSDRIEGGQVCPHCGRRSLVTYLTDGIVRCEKDPQTGREEDCVCRDSYCECKVRNYRHEWYRNPPATTPALLRKKWKASSRSWHGLARDQALHERETAETNHQPKEPPA